MNALEWRVAFSLAAVYAVRMLGLFMILPVFALYAHTLPGSTDLLAGIAIGIYGLTQAMFQIPLGIASDRIGRKPVIIGGLLVFALGSMIAALSDSIELIIVGRTLQGMGAVAAATMALAADLTREENRSRVMAFIGMTIGFSFMAAIILGPILYTHAGMSGIFWFTFGLALSGILLILFAVPTPLHIRAHRDAGIISDYLLKALKNPALLRMNAGVFALHLVMTANFLVIPSLFKDELGLATLNHWQVYLPVFLVAFIGSIPLIIVAEKRHKIKPMLLGAIALLVVAEIFLALGYGSSYSLLAAFSLFFLGFNFLEAIQPSLVAKYSTVETKGTAMGIYNSTQFLGIFVGGVLGGWVNQQWHAAGVFWFSALVAAIWLIITPKLPAPSFYTSRVVRFTATVTDWESMYQALQKVRGIYEVAIVAEEQVAYLKVDKKELDEQGLRAILGAAA
ncbi:MFS transporter [uncultured Thiothrix sp.]|uniref:MFS transporter n=1 Tax=uncultured Thiothrix sp. TaxID=223185 RepID=UPI002606D105|nr:MFS transporter [uncultured Thiothrix sp.]HMT92971.1 MFS transporter [Thiolinea sp.]